MPFMSLEFVEGGLNMGKYKVTYDVGGAVFTDFVSEHTARLLERAKEAGKVERSKEIKELLGVK